MKPVTLKEILPFAQYEILRPRLRPLIIAEKERRRLAVGEHLTLLFENGQTVWYQVEEMVRSERISNEDAIRHEIDTYNELLPRPGELTATMLLEYGDEVERDAALRALVGFERHFWIRIGDRREPARFDARQIATDRISAVQFVRFPLGGLDQDEFLKFSAAGRIAIEADHPQLTASAPITGAIAKALAGDLADT
ncbi:MAG TPA: DUF3501 family protein [Candidatus Binataceae bacterium]|nr:DUF3501 family protein [Candidatus Binataceae bacterium]